ncbi:MAG: MoaD/ThiS family protein [candidate division Zixibacteria bacterium]|nr:MoaD/ThiS family protein [candidate division Zixibacteria bacterium]
MEIKVRLFATLQQYLPHENGRHPATLEIRRGETIASVLKALKIPKKMPKIILVNGKYAREDLILQPGDVVSVFPPLGGGQEPKMSSYPVVLNKLKRLCREENPDEKNPGC